MSRELSAKPARHSPLTGYKLEVFDEDITADDLLGWCYSDPQGQFDFRFEQSAFKDSRIEGKPELELRSSEPAINMSTESSIEV